MDALTVESFRKLWTIYKTSTERADYDDPEFWDKLVSDAGKITTDAVGADDPEFIKDFAIAVLDSIERLSRKNT